MSDNTARARDELRGQRRAVSDHVDKWRRYSQSYEKDGAARTVARAQAEIAKIKSKHPSLRMDSSWEDSWTPRDR